MIDLIFSTGNSQKFNIGYSVCSDNNISLLQETRDIDEIQSEDTEYVARCKAEAAFALFKKPVIISDDAWSISGLNGFPGTYAKSINEWLKPDDMIRLTKELTDRKASLIQTLVYQDSAIQKIFSRETVGTLLKEPRGENGATIQKIISFELDGVTSISEMIGNKTHYSGESTLLVWHDFVTWYKENM